MWSMTLRIWCLTHNRRKAMYPVLRLLRLFAAVSLVLLLNPEDGFSGERSAKDKGIVAEVNGKAITVRELEGPLAQQIYEMEKEVFELKKKRLDELIGQQLLNEEAARRGIGVEELLTKEAYSKAPEVTDEQAEQFYRQYKHRMLERPEAELKQKSREILKKYRLLSEKEKYIESLRAKAKISIHLMPPEPRELSTR